MDDGCQGYSRDALQKAGRIKKLIMTVCVNEHGGIYGYRPKWLTSGDPAEFETQSKLGWESIKRM